VVIPHENDGHPTGDGAVGLLAVLSAKQTGVEQIIAMGRNRNAHASSATDIMEMWGQIERSDGLWSWTYAAAAFSHSVHEALTLRREASRMEPRLEYTAIIWYGGTGARESNCSSEVPTLESFHRFSKERLPSGRRLHQNDIS
jgi:hypothetical protein